MFYFLRQHAVALAAIGAAALIAPIAASADGGLPVGVPSVPAVPSVTSAPAVAVPGVANHFTVSNVHTTATTTGVCGTSTSAGKPAAAKPKPNKPKGSKRSKRSKRSHRRSTQGTESQQLQTQTYQTNSSSCATVRALASLTLGTAQTDADFEFTEPSCIDGETVSLKGHLTVINQTVVSDSGNMHEVSQWKASGTGVGLNATNVKVASYSSSDDQITDTNLLNLPIEYNQVFYTKVIRQGETATGDAGGTSSTVGDDLFMRWQMHFTINANGQTTAQPAQMYTECR
jgi:hypothetical protein